MNVLQNLTELYNHLPQESTYRNVCEGILENLEAAAEGTIYDLAELTNSSRTTIWRMLQKMGYKSFSDFHFELKSAVSKYTYYNRLLTQKKYQDAQSMKEQLLAQMKAAHAFVEEQLEINEVEEIAEKLMHADKVVFYTHYKSSTVASLQQNLSVMGKKIGYYSLLPEMLEDSITLTKDSIVFASLIEHAETMDMEPVFQNCKSNGATIYGILMGNSKYRKYVNRELVNNERGGVVAGILSYEMYFILLSEVFRMKYIDL